MSCEREAAIWRMIGSTFERIGNGEKPPTGYAKGLCFAAHWNGLPAYADTGARVRASDCHGPCASDGPHPKEAYHRALTAYLIAEMVLDGRAPGVANE